MTSIHHLLHDIQETRLKATRLYEMAEFLLKRWKPLDKFEMELKLAKYEKLVKFGNYIMKGKVESKNAQKVMGILQEWVDSICEEERVKWREWEMGKMMEFNAMYGFMPNDVEAKKVYVDKIFYEEEGVMPKNDKERNKFFEVLEMTEMMRMEWKAKWVT